ncbi:MAG: AMP-binding protein [Acidisphaera sp.]|nr:AMP-binding protein [Acidisphaera sp.]
MSVSDFLARGGAWTVPPAIPVDLNGPDGRPYEKLPPDSQERPLAALFAKVAGRHPDAPALDDGTLRLSYRETAERAASLARRIAASTPPDVLVGVCLADAAACLGILACFAAARPCLVLDDTLPDERRTAIMRDAGLAACIVAREGATPLPEGVAAIRFAAASADAALSLPADPPPIPPDAPALILYTSGSTGQPKGIVHGQRAILMRMAQAIDTWHVGPGDRLLSLASPATISGIVDLFSTLLSGAMLLKLDPRRVGWRGVLALAADRRITCFHAVPAVLRRLCAVAPDAASLLAASFGGVQIARISGEEVLRSDVERLRRMLPPGAYIHTVYGMTEILALLGWYVTDDAIAPSAPMLSAQVPSGYLLPGHSYCILDEQGRPVPDGEAGELVVRSRHLALGEWREGRCVQGSRLADDPDDPSCRILRTGDVVRRRPDGLYQVLERRDRQVKINGQRVEITEVEDALRRMPDIADAAVAARHDGATVGLLAVIVPVTAPLCDAAALLRSIRERLARQLPAAMVPARIVLAEQLPCLPGGKIDRAALLQLGGSAGVA